MSSNSINPHIQVMESSDPSLSVGVDLISLQPLHQYQGNDPMIIQLILSASRGFIPTRHQVSMLRHALQHNILSVNPGNLSNSAWHQLLWSPDTGGCLFANHLPAILADQRYRAQVLLDIMLSRGFMKVRLMDGHGRFTLCFFQAIIERGLNPDAFSVFVVDINESANQWHETFFPSGCLVAHEDILIELEIAYQQDHDYDYFTYLNFCAIRDAIRDFGFDTFTRLMLSYAQTESLMLSFSLRGMRVRRYSARTYHEQTIGDYIKNEIVPMWQFITRRFNYYTGLMTCDPKKQASRYRLSFDTVEEEEEVVVEEEEVEEEVEEEAEEAEPCQPVQLEIRKHQILTALSSSDSDDDLIESDQLKPRKRFCRIPSSSSESNC